MNSKGVISDSNSIDMNGSLALDDLWREEKKKNHCLPSENSDACLLEVWTIALCELDQEKLKAE